MMQFSAQTPFVDFAVYLEMWGRPKVRMSHAEGYYCCFICFGDTRFGGFAETWDGAFIAAFREAHDAMTTEVIYA